MALIKCPECGKEVSDRAPKCPNCGYKNNDIEDVANKKDKPSGVGIIVGITCASIMVLWGIIVLIVIIYSLTEPNNPDVLGDVITCFIAWLPSCLPFVIYLIISKVIKAKKRNNISKTGKEVNTLSNQVDKVIDGITSNREKLLLNHKKIIIDTNAFIENLSYNIDANNDKITITFNNMGHGKITAVKFRVRGYNSFGDNILINGQEIFSIVIQDVSIELNSFSGELCANLPSKEIRKVKIIGYQICFSDGRIESHKRSKRVAVVLEEYNQEDITQKEIVSVLENKYHKPFYYRAKELDEGWICGCGRYNTDEICSNCGAVKSDIFIFNNDEEVYEILDSYNKQKSEEERINSNAKKKYVKDCIISAIGISIIVAVVVNFMILGGRSTYKSIEEMQEDITGVYSLYHEDGSVRRQIKISESNIIIRYPNLGTAYDMELEIDKWNYKRGIIKAEFEKLIIKKDGTIIDSDKEKYEKSSGVLIDSSSKSKYTENSSYTQSSGLKISSFSAYKGKGGYAICDGTIVNYGNETRYFVKVKCSYLDSIGNVVDTDWTYAVGGEGLAPGESCTFEMMKSSDADIDYGTNSGNVSIVGYE